MRDIEYMRLAVQLAKSGIGQTAPNPHVGAVVVNNDQIVGMGAHLLPGKEHAEVYALNMAGEKAKDSTLYVTLEPCSHYGKTPPCVNLIIEKQVKRVVVGMKDPNPKVCGKGIKSLEEAGINVEVGVLESEVKQLNTYFKYYMENKIPYVTLKNAMSLDGKIATATGESKWITGEIARLDSHSYRYSHDAILVGVGTIIKDNPSLTNRFNKAPKNPIRIVLDRNLRTPLDSRIILDNQAETWIITNTNVPQKKKVEYSDKNCKIIPLNYDVTNEVDSILKFLGEKGVTSLFVEGGSSINASFLRERKFNQMITYLSPKVIGGALSPGPFGGKGINKINEVVELNIISIENTGEDIKIVSEPKSI
ncbi:bifunctional diaminohydroxyphosphoribosylaminopyrimidine deaminase/5-amino-6-(5-phosphoribosylamino)uracil reductase RibD [Streptomyces venezuelae]|uniref:bifunctional diaminohydroxyphosphoribosylaminopyrimidine deaminase/5-amino-6-(5-phosphoribosylamino)uracil reductase RibD n=1 Tax=Bacillus paramycoides TaxID=2026194 RepID=UPI003416FB14